MSKQESNVPLRPMKRPKAIKNNTPETKYDTLFQRKNSGLSRTLKTIRKQVPYKNADILDAPLYLYDGCNADQVRSFSKANVIFASQLHNALCDKNNECVGFFALIDIGSMYHMIGGLLYPTRNHVELFDPNALMVNYPIEHDMFCTKVSKLANKNSLYDSVINMLTASLPTNYEFTCYVERQQVSVCPFVQKGACALWSIIYVLKRMNGQGVRKVNDWIATVHSKNNSLPIFKQFLNALIRGRNSRNNPSLYSLI